MFVLRLGDLSSIPGSFHCSLVVLSPESCPLTAIHVHVHVHLCAHTQCVKKWQNRNPLAVFLLAFKFCIKNVAILREGSVSFQDDSQEFFRCLSCEWWERVLECLRLLTSLSARN